jgi:hypothetical protein
MTTNRWVDDPELPEECRYVTRFSKTRDNQYPAGALKQRRTPRDRYVDPKRFKRSRHVATVKDEE